MRIVVDTNLWVSYLLQPNSPLSPRLDQITRAHTLLYSFDTVAELAAVLTRRKFARYVDPEDVRTFIERLAELGEEVAVTSRIRACRDPKDDKFLALALDGDADCILSGDSDLLELNPFEGASILKVSDFRD